MGNGAADSSSRRVAEPRATQGERKRHSRPVGFVIRLVKEKPLGAAGAVIILVLLFTGIFADLLAPFGMNEIHAYDTQAPPSARFWLGTDNLGRDMLSRIIFGARISVIIGLAATTVSTLVSAFLGMLSGYIGGKFDLIVQRFVDGWMSLPGLIVLMIIMSMIGASIWSIIIVLGISYGIGSSRIIRGFVISIKDNVYISAAVAIGSSAPRIFTRHILPNIMAPLIVQFSVHMPAVILAEASLSFLGFGIPPPMPSWGGMLSGSGRYYMHSAPWMAIWPGLALATVVYGANMFGDAVRDLLDPRLRGGVARYGVKLKEISRKK